MVPEDVMDQDVENGRKLYQSHPVKKESAELIGGSSMQILLDEGIGSDEAELAREEALIGERLWNFNLSSWPANNQKSRRLRLFLKTANGEVLGGIIGKIYRGALFIDKLYIDNPLRGRGWGELLLLRAESIARAEGAVFSHLDTFSFQAPGFYEKLGYETFGVLDDYPDGLKRYFYKKKL